MGLEDATAWLSPCKQTISKQSIDIVRKKLFSEEEVSICPEGSGQEASGAKVYEIVQIEAICKTVEKDQETTLNRICTISSQNECPGNIRRDISTVGHEYSLLMNDSPIGNDGIEAIKEVEIVEEMAPSSSSSLSSKNELEMPILELASLTSDNNVQDGKACSTSDSSVLQRSESKGQVGAPLTYPLFALQCSSTLKKLNCGLEVSSHSLSEHTITAAEQSQNVIETGALNISANSGVCQSDQLFQPTLEITKETGPGYSDFTTDCNVTPTLQLINCEPQLCLSMSQIDSNLSEGGESCKPAHEIILSQEIEPFMLGLTTEEEQDKNLDANIRASNSGYNCTTYSPVHDEIRHISTSQDTSNYLVCNLTNTSYPFEVHPNSSPMNKTNNSTPNFNELHQNSCDFGSLIRESVLIVNNIECFEHDQNISVPWALSSVGTLSHQSEVDYSEANDLNSSSSQCRSFGSPDSKLAEEPYEENSTVGDECVLSETLEIAHDNVGNHDISENQCKTEVNSDAKVSRMSSSHLRRSKKEGIRKEEVQNHSSIPLVKETSLKKRKYVSQRMLAFRHSVDHSNSPTSEQSTSSRNMYLYPRRTETVEDLRPPKTKASNDELSGSKDGQAPVFFTALKTFLHSAATTEKSVGISSSQDSVGGSHPNEAWKKVLQQAKMKKTKK